MKICISASQFGTLNGIGVTFRAPVYKFSLFVYKYKRRYQSKLRMNMPKIGHENNYSHQGDAHIKNLIGFCHA